MEVSVRRMSDPSLGKRRSSNPLVGLDGGASQQLMIPLGEGELGLTITNNAHGKGVVVSALLDGSLAAAAGLNVGDVIVSVNGTLAADHFVAIEAIDAARGMLALVLGAPTRRVSLARAAAGGLGVTCRARRRGAGVEVSALEADGVCAQSGMLVGDVLLSVGGRLVDEHAIAIQLLEQQWSVPTSCVLLGTLRAVVLDKSKGDVGLTLADAQSGDGGVVVIGVHPGGLGIAAGVQLGDVIISVNHTLVDAHDQAIGLVDAAPDTVQLVLRAEAASYIPSLH